MQPTPGEDQGGRASVRLDQGWRVRDFAPGEGLAAGAQQPELDLDDWWPIDVPGDVHRALIAAGRIPEPFYDRNETACAWMEEREWWYRATFEGPPSAAADERLLLVFEGLDTFATVYLNGEPLGGHGSMFRPAVFDVSGRLRPNAPNSLAVRFDPPLARIAGKTLSQWGRNPERTAMRKAQFGFGWDWGPRLPTIGLWRPVRLERQRRAALTGVHFATVHLSPEHGRAAVAVRVEVEAFASTGRLEATIRLIDPEGQQAAAGQVELGTTSEATAYVSVEQPRLWWTHELGEPARYQLEVRLLEDGALLDRDTRQVGIRTLRLDQAPDPDERGTRFFRFVLNGVPIFAKGADWIPCDSFVGAIAPERYTRLLELAQSANMTMLRIWGGGIYEADHFYAECDRLGLLVWHDFMFACAMYPEDDPAFVAEVDAEARYQVRRLRHHPCLALWCGNNENQWLHERRFWDQPELPPYGALYYDTILPQAVADLDGQTPYWPGSPFGGDDHNSRLEGNVHNWEVWHGNVPRHFGEPPQRDPSPEHVSYLHYADDLGRFISEFGLHAAPARSTLERVLPADQRSQHSPALDWHNKDNPKDKGDTLLLTTTGLPRDLDQYILFSQWAQAEGLKFGVEHFRRRKPHCSGTLVWQFDDCWPVLSWSIVDYYGVAKASYFFLRRAYAPRLASFKALPDGTLELWLTNDTLAAWQDDFSVRCATFDGRTVWHTSGTWGVAPNSSACVQRWSTAACQPGADRYVWVQAQGASCAPNRHLFAAYKDLLRQPTAPRLRVLEHDEAGHRLRVELAAPDGAYVSFAHLHVPDEHTRYSDNYLDLEPGARHELVLSNPRHPLDPSTLHLGYA